MRQTMRSAVGALVQCAVVSVLKIFLAGAFCAWTFRSLVARGKIQRALPKELAVMTSELLLPLFIFTHCAEGLTADLVQRLTFVPILCVAFLLNGAVVGAGAALVSCTPRTQWPVVVTCVTFSNIIGMPLPLLISIIHGVPSLRDAPRSQITGTSCIGIHDERTLCPAVTALSLPRRC